MAESIPLGQPLQARFGEQAYGRDRKSTRLNSSHDQISYAVFCLKKKISVARRGVPLHRATTASLDALKKFADGQRAWDAGGWREAKELWLAAAARDSDFALVHVA